MIGLLQLAARLAEIRTGGSILTRYGEVRAVPRGIDRRYFPTSAEYYDILDRIERGEQP